MWYAPEKYQRNVKDTNLELLELKGELESKAAKISLAKFLRANLGFTVAKADRSCSAPVLGRTLGGATKVSTGLAEDSKAVL